MSNLLVHVPGKLVDPSVRSGDVNAVFSTKHWITKHGLVGTVTAVVAVDAGAVRKLITFVTTETGSVANCTRSLHIASSFASNNAAR